MSVARSPAEVLSPGASTSSSESAAFRVAPSSSSLQVSFFGVVNPVCRGNDDIRFSSTLRRASIRAFCRCCSRTSASKVLSPRSAISDWKSCSSIRDGFTWLYTHQNPELQPAVLPPRIKESERGLGKSEAAECPLVAAKEDKGDTKTRENPVGGDEKCTRQVAFPGV